MAQAKCIWVRLSCYTAVFFSVCHFNYCATVGECSHRKTCPGNSKGHISNWSREQASMQSYHEDSSEITSQSVWDISISVYLYLALENKQDLKDHIIWVESETNIIKLLLCYCCIFLLQKEKMGTITTRPCAY